MIASKINGYLNTITAAMFVAVTMVASWEISADMIDISSIEELQRIGNDPAYPLDGDYRITQVIDATETANWNGGAGFDPIGHYIDVANHQDFSGTLDGQGYPILGLTINRPDEDYVGLFGHAETTGMSITNLHLRGGSVVGRNNVGAIGGNFMGALDNCSVNLSVTGNEYVGGLAGGYTRNYTIPQSTAIHLASFKGEVQGNSYVGGIVGQLRVDSRIENCVVDAIVTGVSTVGGVSGFISEVSNVTDCHASGEVSGVTSIGGIVGSAEGSITGCSSSCVITGSWYVGGLVGYGMYKSVISSCYATSAVVATGEEGGGMVGHLHGAWVMSEGDPVLTYRGARLSMCFASGTVSCPANAGGLIGKNAGFPEDCYAVGAVSGTSNAGGLIGQQTADASVVRCYSVGSVQGTTQVGGLIGASLGGEVNLSFWDTVTSGQLTSAGGTGLETNLMKKAVTYTGAGWNFTSTWDIEEDNSYPHFLYETSIEGEAPQEFTVSVIGRPQVEIGDTVVLKAVVSLPGDAIAYAWFKDDVLIPGITGREYYLGPAETSHAGTYHVSINDFYGETHLSAPFVLHVLEQGSLPLRKIAGLGLFVLIIGLVIVQSTKKRVFV